MDVIYHTQEPREIFLKPYLTNNCESNIYYE